MDDALPGSMEAFARASRHGRFGGEGEGQEEEEEEEEALGTNFYRQKVRTKTPPTRPPTHPSRPPREHAGLAGWLACAYPPTHQPTSGQAIPAGMEMEMQLMREERARDQELKERWVGGWVGGWFVGGLSG